MAYKAFILRENGIKFELIFNWINQMKNSERGLISQVNERGYRVHEFNLNDGVLVQIVGTMNNDWATMNHSYFTDFRVLGSKREINNFVKDYNKNNGPGNPLKEIKVLKSTDMGTLDNSQLEKLSKEGFVIKHEFGQASIIDPTPVL